MANTWQKLMGGAAVAVTLCTTSQAAASEVGTIILHVQNYAGLPAAELAAAQAHASAVYAAAHVSVAWIEGFGEPQGLDPDALHLDVLLLSPEMTEKKCRTETIGRQVLGRASHATKRAYIFVARVADVAARARVDSIRVLGTVIAHEVGHLLLPESSHAEAGIMKANPDLRSDVPEYFTEAQTDLIRIAASNRSKA